MIKVQVIQDLRPNMGNIRDQKQRPTCLAFASSDVHSFHHKSPEHFSVEYLYYNALKKMKSANHNSGLNIHAVTRTLKEDGQPHEMDWCYLDTLPDDINQWLPPDKIGEKWMGDIAFEKPDTSDVIATITSGKPLVIGLTLTKGFFYLSKEKPIISMAANDQITPHRHAVVGVATGTDNIGDHYVLVRNSWGAGWGDSGHAWISKTYLDNQLNWVGKMVGTKK